MRILAHVPLFVPDHNSGAEWMLYDMLNYLQKQGHTCAVMVDRSSVSEYNHIKIHIDKGDYNVYKDYDVYITHLGKTGRAFNITQKLRKPLFHIIHNTYNNSCCRVKKNQRVIYNSEWAKKECHFNQPNIVCHPLIDPQRYFVKNDGQHITMININKNKGGEILKKIAPRMPDHRFLAVKGSYGDQVLDQPENVTVVENTPDIRKIYSKTRILLMPSKYESYGRTAIEAMTSGIPVIANKTPGLEESMGDAGIWANMHSIDDWVGAIYECEENYLTLSNKAKQRADEVNASDDFARLEYFLTENH